MEATPHLLQSTAWMWPGSLLFFSPSPTQWASGTLISFVAVLGEGNPSPEGQRHPCHASQMSLIWWPPHQYLGAVIVADEVFSVFDHIPRAFILPFQVSHVVRIWGLECLGPHDPLHMWGL